MPAGNAKSVHEMSRGSIHEMTWAGHSDRTFLILPRKLIGASRRAAALSSCSPSLRGRPSASPPVQTNADCAERVANWCAKLPLVLRYITARSTDAVVVVEAIAGWLFDLIDGVEVSYFRHGNFSLLALIKYQPTSASAGAWRGFTPRGLTDTIMKSESWRGQRPQ